jgi:hypothetical protein
MAANVTDRLQDDVALGRVEGGGGQNHLPVLERLPQRTSFQQAPAKPIVVAVDRASLVSVDPRAVTGEGYEIGPGLVAAGPGRF